MNEQLKFSWGHIFAFVALIFIFIVTISVGLYEMGGTTSTNWDSPQAILTTIKCYWSSFAILSVLLIVFIGAQWAKAVKRKFNKAIRMERAIVFGSPFIFIACMQPFYSFCYIHSKSSEIIEHYKSIVDASKQLFTDYERYANERITNYEHTLDRIIAHQRNSRKTEFEGFNFKGTNREIHIQKGNMTKTLRLQLLSENYYDMKGKVMKWADDQHEPSTWNLALIGKLGYIKAGIHDYNERLNTFSSHVLSNEEFDGNDIQTFAESSTVLASADNEFEEVKKLSSNMSFPPVWSLLASIIIYFALLLPYLIQERNTKNPFRLIDNGSKPETMEGVFTINDTSETDENDQDTVKPFTLNEDAPTKKADNDEQGDYKPFRL